MSALTPHIRVLRVEAAELIKIGQEAHSSGKEAIEAGEHDSAMVELSAAVVLTRMAQAKFAAADRLDAEDAALQPPREGKDQPITYDPKGLR
jgi:hypothetical protein